MICLQWCVVLHLVYVLTCYGCNEMLVVICVALHSFIYAVKCFVCNDVLAMIGYVLIFM